MRDGIDRKDVGNVQRDFFKRWPTLYYFIVGVFGPLWVGLGPKKFLQNYPTEGIKINVGSGPRVIAEDVINIDIFNYPNVDIIADSANLPYKDGEVERIICADVLEHLKNFDSTIKEMRRVLNKGGLIYVSTPFMYPFHSSPSDFQRWTYEGLKLIFRDFEVVEGGVRAGPFSGFQIWCSYVLASLLSFGSERLYWLVLNLSIFIFFPIKLFDLIFSYLPFATNNSSVLYIVLKK